MSSRRCALAGVASWFVLATAVQAMAQVPMTASHPTRSEGGQRPSQRNWTPRADNREALTDYLDAIAMAHLDHRRARVDAISDQRQAEAYQASFRLDAVRLMGGLPEARTPLRARTVGAISLDGFSLERVILESQPGFYLTANVYVPATPGAHPAVLLTPGHSADGKVRGGVQAQIAAQLARRGVVVMFYDVLGHGERLQTFDPDRGVARAGGATGEHTLAFQQTLPIGDNPARYFVWDAMRGLDYLSSRPDVDATRLGTLGCSGGGMVSAYLAALDPRVKAAAAGCYISDFEHMIPTYGPQEAEQSLPDFIARGYNVTDWVLAAAPRPFAIVSTHDDSFPLGGAEAAYEDARRFYRLFGAEDQVQWIVGPGGHGALAPVAPQIIGFFLKTLNGDEAPVVMDEVRIPAPEDLLVTSTGQVSTAFEAQTVQTLSRQRADRLRPPALPAGGTGPEARAELARRIRDVARVTAAPGAPAPSVAFFQRDQRQGYRIDALRISSEPGVILDGFYARHEGASRPALVLLTDESPEALRQAGGLIDQYAERGWNVFALRPRGWGGTEEVKSALVGDWGLLSLRALLVGKTVPGMRMDDAVQAINWLVAQPSVDASRIALHGSGIMGPVALQAGVLDPRVQRIFLDEALASYRDIVDAPVSLDTPEVNLPGVLKHYDLPDLVAAMPPGSVVVSSPVDSRGQALGAARRQALFGRPSVVLSPSLFDRSQAAAYRP
ncbi:MULTISPECIES: alpha/beta hydrolase family protein [unclassified Brevundimonas]|uniref:alpha/beta hydrolase family protein n=1 Tax=unclassified Brevundimonas TaxID=2622653 RepID=UPI0025C12A9C|nr:MULTISPECIES: acetylxylan esterase [unclassified Brevundimonas]